jgi:hypothetical protein
LRRWQCRSFLPQEREELVKVENRKVENRKVENRKPVMLEEHNVNTKNKTNKYLEEKMKQKSSVFMVIMAMFIVLALVSGQQSLYAKKKPVQVVERIQYKEFPVQRVEAGEGENRVKTGYVPANWVNNVPKSLPIGDILTKFSQDPAGMKKALKKAKFTQVVFEPDYSIVAFRGWDKQGSKTLDEAWIETNFKSFGEGTTSFYNSKWDAYYTNDGKLFYGGLRLKRDPRAKVHVHDMQKTESGLKTEMERMKADYAKKFEEVRTKVGYRPSTSRVKTIVGDKVDSAKDDIVEAVEEVGDKVAASKKYLKQACEGWVKEKKDSKGEVVKDENGDPIMVKAPGLFDRIATVNSDVVATYNLVKKEAGSLPTFAWILILLVVGGVGFLIYRALYQTGGDDMSGALRNIHDRLDTISNRIPDPGDAPPAG